MSLDCGNEKYLNKTSVGKTSEFNLNVSRLCLMVTLKSFCFLFPVVPFMLEIFATFHDDALLL